jgi:hypothetical protein
VRRFFSEVGQQQKPPVRSVYSLPLKAADFRDVHAGECCEKRHVALRVSSHSYKSLAASALSPSPLGDLVPAQRVLVELHSQPRSPRNLRVTVRNRFDERLYQ